MNLRPLSLNELMGFTLVAFLIFAVSAWICGNIPIEIDSLQTAFSPPNTVEVSGD